MRLLLLSTLLLSAPVFAEAGLPYSFCGVSSCSCGAATCGCGQVCNLNSQTCGSNQMGFCSTDSNCAATCDQFICEGNVCVKGVRNPPDAGSMIDAGSGHGNENGGGGCSSTSGPLLLALSAALLRRRRRS